MHPTQNKGDPTDAPKTDRQDREHKMQSMIDSDGAHRSLTPAMGAVGVLHGVSESCESVASHYKRNQQSELRMS
jgi:hypothetical protein